MLINKKTNFRLLAYQPAAGTALFDLSIAGNASVAVFVSDEDPLGQNPTGGEQIFTVDIGTGGIVQVTNDPETPFLAFADFDITDDGSEVVFVSSEDYETGVNPNNDSNVFLAATNGSSITQVTRNTGGSLGDPQISGDGSLIIFTSRDDLVAGSNPNLDLQIFSINDDGTGLAQVTTGDPIPEDIVMSEDGLLIAYHSPMDPFGANNDNSREIFVIGTNGLGHAQLTMSAGNSYSPKISDGGARVAFVSDGEVIAGGNPDGSYEMFVANADGSGLTQITDSTRDSGVYESGAPGSLDISGNGVYMGFGSDADLTGENGQLTHTIFWASVVAGVIGQPLKDGTVPASITSRSADNPHMTNDGTGILFDSDVNYSFNSTGSDDKIFTTVRQ